MYTARGEGNEMNDKALTTIRSGVETVDSLSNFGKFLRLHTAEGDASEHTI